MFRKVRTRIVVSFMVLIAVLAGALLYIIIETSRDYHMALIEREVAEKIDFVELAIEDNPSAYTAGGVARRIDRIRRLAGVVRMRITLVGADGTVIADSDYSDVEGMDNHRYRKEILEAASEGTGRSIRFSDTLKTGMLYMAKKTDRCVIRLARPLGEVEESIGRLRRYILGAGSIALLVSMVIVVLISRMITRPIGEAIRFARDFSSGDFSRRIPNYGDDEIGTLQKSLNRLADTVVGKIDSLVFEQNKLEKTFESINDGIAVIGGDRRILVANGAFRSLLDIDTAVTGKVFFEVIRNRGINARVEEARATGRPAAFETTLLNGRHCEVLIKPISGGESLQGLLLVLHDTTEKKKIEQMKTDLVGNMSHELKTPIAILKGYLETLEGHIEEPDMARDLLRKALASVDRQSSLVNDILKLNRLETTSDFPDEPISIGEILRGSIEILGPRAGGRNVTLSLEETATPVTVRGNRFLAEEIFFNLIDNAISYNHEGGSVVITLGARGGRPAVTIADTGIGIPRESIDRIFERFYRVDRSRSRSTGGTGLGLSIVKHAADLLGWKVSVESGPSGTVFTVET